MSGFVLPYNSNICYINVYPGHYFGEIDFVVPATENNVSIEEMMNKINS